MLVELGLMEQRHKAVLEVLGGLPVVEVARRYGVARQTVHEWMRRYATFGFAGLFDRSCRPATCPHQMRPEVEARIVALRRAHSGWGPHMLRYQLEKEQLDFVPTRSSIYRCLCRHGLIDPKKRRRRREDYQRSRKEPFHGTVADRWDEKGEPPRDTVRFPIVETGSRPKSKEAGMKDSITMAERPSLPS
ncbi:MAG: helix-turn-helix domain containing protein [Actinobacteria bacterium]|nr:helix-turn-helix domain containing protein [Actinomycetota bacterium]